LLLDMHHAITDAVSLNLMMSELWDLYGGRRLGDIGIHYKDYAVWQRYWADRGAFRQDEQFWLDRMRNYHWTMIPATERQSRSPSYDQSVLKVDSALWREILHFCEQNQITAMTFLMTAICQVIGQYTSEHDVTIGLRISRRSQLPLQSMLGPFVEDAVYRYQRPPHASLRQLLESTQGALASVLEHADYPYEQINAALQHKSPTPNGELFTILVNHVPAIVPVQNAPVMAHFVPLPRPAISKYYMNLRLRNHESLVLDAKFRSDRYSAAFVTTFLQSVVSAMQRLMSSYSSVAPGHIDRKMSPLFEGRTL